MQIQLEEAVKFPATQIEYLDDQLIRFQLQNPRQPSAYQRFFLGELSLAEIRPEAPNQGAVQYNLNTLAGTLDKELSRMQNRSLGEKGAILSRQDFLLLQVDHFCRPAYLYTNGQALVSLVRRNETKFEIGYHESLRAFHDFNSEFGFYGFIDADDFQIATSFEDAEKAARELLANARTWTLNLRRGAEIEQLVMQPAGSTAGERGYSIETLFATFRASRFVVRMGGGPWSDHEPYRVLNELRPEGFVVEACATCLYFRFSTMSRDMSSGSAGYCTFPNTGQPKSNRERVSVFHICPEYTFIPDQERATPYLRQLS